MPTLLLVDGSSYLYRAFHALPDLRTSGGQPTGAIRGVLSMLRVLETDYKADYRAVVFDAKGKTFRDDWYPEYKAHRPPMPDDLVAQIEPLHECIRAAGWPLLMETGVEADDVIGTLARQAGNAGIDCVISTGDKDLAQLVNQHVTLVNTMNGERLDIAGVKAKFGVAPERIVDYLALIGDSVDNVPGVAKVGPKTAVKWLDAYGSLDSIVAHANEIGGAVGENLRKHLDFLPLGVKLVTVACELPLPVAIDGLAPQAPDTARLEELYARLEFKGWLRELKGEAPAPAARQKVAAPPAPTFEMPVGVEPDRSGYQCILDEAALQDWLARLDAAPLVSLDTETTDLDPLQARLVGISFAIEGGQAAYLPLGHHYAGAPQQLPLAATLEKLRPWLESPRHAKLGQHLKYDRHVFANHGVQLAGIVEDTLLQSYVLESDKAHDLGALALRHCGLSTISYDAVTGKGASRISFAQVDVARAAEYSAEDADVTLRVHQALHLQLAAAPELEALYRDLELPVAEVLFRMERNGVLIDADALARQSEELGRKILAIEAEAQQLAGQPFNLASPKQLAEILFNQQGLPVVKKTPSGAPSTDEEVLEKLAEDYPLPKKILEHRSFAKLKNTYTDKLPKMINPATGRVHTSFGQGHGGHRATGLDRPQPAEHPDPHRRGPPHPLGLHRAGKSPYRQRRLFADRVAHHGPSLGRPAPAGGLCTGRGRASRHRRRSLRPDADRGDERTAPRRQGDQLRPDLRHERLRPGQADRRRPHGGAGLHGPLLRALSRCRPLHGRDPRRGPRKGLRRDRVRPPPVAARDPLVERRPPPGRRTRGDQRADAGHRRRPDQARHARGAGLARRAATEIAADAAGA
jgi:DNA polymerase-1